MRRLVFVLVACVLSAGGSLALAEAVDPVQCDVDANGFIDRFDLLAIRAASGSVVPPGSVMDPNGDGVVNVADVRFCQRRCSFNGCEAPPSL